MIKVLLSRVADQHGFLKRVSSVSPPTEVSIKGIYFLFGRYNGTIPFETPNLKKDEGFHLKDSVGFYLRNGKPNSYPAEEL